MNKENAKRRLSVIENEAKELRMMIEEPEVAALRHMDFGISNTGSYFIRLEDVIRWFNRDTTTVSRMSPSSRCFVKGTFGNLLDMMKDWDKDLESYSCDQFEAKIVCRKKIQIRCPILWKYGNLGMSAYYNLNDVEEIRNALGRMIATVKRKNA